MSAARENRQQFMAAAMPRGPPPPGRGPPPPGRGGGGGGARGGVRSMRTNAMQVQSFDKDDDDSGSMSNCSNEDVM